jgi:glycosyltransferase involved in cell wall biosynthesis
MTQLRIAMLTDYLGMLAGTEASLVNMASALGARGHAVVVAAHSREDGIHPHWRNRLARAGVELWEFPREAAQQVVCRDLAARLMTWRANLVHAIPMAGLLAAWLDLRAPIRCVATETSEGTSRCTWYDAAHFPVFGRLDAIHAPCHSVASALRTTFGYGGPVEVIPHVVPVHEGRRPLGRPEVERRWSLGAITRLRVEKGIEFMLAALAQAAGRHDVTLTIYGEAVELARTLEIIRALDLAGRVTIAGPFHDDEIEEVMERHCVFLLTSLFEGLPQAVLSACAHGRVSIATAVGGVPEILRDGGGVAVPVGDPRTMAEALSALLDDPDRLVATSERAFRTFEERYHPREVVPTLEAFYRRVSS